MNVRDQHIYWYHLLFQTGTFEVWDVWRGGEQCEDDKVTVRWRWQGGNGEVETGEQGEAAKLEDAGGRERLLGWRRLERRARLLGWRRLVPEEAITVNHNY